MRPRKPVHAAGFSMVELLVVVAIIAIMAAAALPAIGSYIRNYRIRGAAEQVAASIQQARLRAVTKNVNLGVVFVTLSDTTYRWVIKDDQSPSPSENPLADVAIATLATDPAQASPLETLPEGVVFGSGCPGFTAATSPGFRFNRLGQWCKPSATVADNCPQFDVGDNRVQIVGPEARICLNDTTNGLTRGISIQRGGRVRVDN